MKKTAPQKGFLTSSYPTYSEVIDLFFGKEKKSLESSYFFRCMNYLWSEIDFLKKREL